MPDPAYRTAALDGKLVRQRSDDGGNSWVTETLLGPAAVGSTGDGTATHASVQATADGQTATLLSSINWKQLAAVLVPILLAMAGFKLVPTTPTPLPQGMEQIAEALKAASSKPPAPIVIQPVTPKADAPPQPEWTLENVRKFLAAQK